ncbi:MAG: PilW family protein [Armatimonadota bacterium]
MKQLIKKQEGFTLVELLVVMALTVIIVGLIFGPVMQSFSFTRRAGTLIRAQDNARTALTRITREFQNAIFAYDNTRQATSFYVQDQAKVVPDPRDPNAMPLVYGARIDIVLPRMHGFCTAPDVDHNPGGVNNPREFVRGEDAAPHCPYDGSLLELRPVQPLAPDTKIVRYFIGLQNPTRPYSSRYQKISVPGPGGDNMFILYRAEFSPYDAKLFNQAAGMSANLAKPNFFYDSNLNGINNPDGTPQTYAQAWRRVSVAIITPRDADLGIVEYVRDPITALYNTVITPTVTFSPTAVNNDPLVAVTDNDNSPENSDSEIPPSVYKAKYGNWVLPYEVSVRRKQPGDPVATIYKAMPRLNSTQTDMCIYKMLPNGIDPDYVVFDINNYESTKSDKTSIGYKFGVGDTMLPGGNQLPELAFTVNTKSGKVNFAFPHIDLTLSNQLSTIFNAKFPVSIVIPTDMINQYYDAAPMQDRYRMWEFHHPANRTLPYGNLGSIQASSILGNSTVVPGLEKVTGPYNNDPVRSILYSRIPFYDMMNEPAPNQYKIDVQHPVLDNNGDLVPGMEGTAAIYFHSTQAEYGTGIPLPAGRQIYLLYYEQNNKPGDSLRANYVTKELLTVSLGVRIYDASTSKPQTVQLTSKVRLRNILN